MKQPYWLRRTAVHIPVSSRDALHSATQLTDSTTPHTDHVYQQNAVPCNARLVQRWLAFRSYQGGIPTILNYKGKVHWKQMLKDSKLPQSNQQCLVPSSWPSPGKWSWRPGYVSGHWHVTWRTWLSPNLSLNAPAALTIYDVGNRLRFSAVYSG